MLPQAPVGTYPITPASALQVKEKSQILPTNKGFNSYGAFAAKDCGTGAYTPGDFVVHFPGW